MKRYCGYCVWWGEIDENGDAIAYGPDGEVIPPEEIGEPHPDCERSVWQYIEEIQEESKRL